MGEAGHRHRAWRRAHRDSGWRDPRPESGIGCPLGKHRAREETGELFEAYVRAYPKLRIFEEQVSTQKLNEQEKEIQSLKGEVEQLRSEKREAEDITTRLEKLVRDLIARVDRIEDKK
jgi:hypothetical protein